jgi:hypothetical protein
MKEILAVAKHSPVLVLEVGNLPPVLITLLEEDQDLAITPQIGQDNRRPSAGILDRP